VVVLVRAGLRDDGASGKPAREKTATVVRTKPAAGSQAKRIYVVRAGDTLASISAANGVTVARLLELNPKAEPTSLFIGDEIRLR
jgi:LysM repeat protein